MKQFAVVGDPIEHSLSPVLHKEIYRQLGINASFEIAHIEKEYLQIFINENKLDGFNVTIPHKESIIPYLDKLDKSAEAIGAVNCVKREKGYNTDWIGFLNAMTNNDIEINGKNCLIIGAGGAARAIAYAFVQAKAKSIIFHNRTKSKVKTLADWINKLYPENNSFGEPEIVVNCTPIGMWPNTNSIPMNIDSITTINVLVDTIYNPFETRWLKMGKTIGIKTIRGLDMFIFQGLASADIWLGEKVSIKLDLETIKKVLKRELC